MELVNQSVIKALVSVETTVERPISNLGRTLIFLAFASISLLLFWVALWALWPAKTYTVRGFTNLPTKVCPSQPVTITLDDHLARVPLVRTLDVTVYNQPIALAGEPVFSELPYPIPAEDIRDGEATSFTRNAPTVEGTYYFRLHVETEVKVARFFATRTVRQDLAGPNGGVTERFEVDDNPSCNGSLVSGPREG